MTLSNLTTSSLSKASAGLLGAGNWATVTATTGTPATGTYTDANGVSWKYYKWTGSGSVTLTDGVVDALLVGGGGGPRTLAGYLTSGEGATPHRGIRPFTAATHTVTIGAGGTASTTDATCAGGSSVLGPFSARGGRLGYAESGLTDDITGASVTYGASSAGSVTANSGNGGAYSGSISGSTGVVIIRVPTAFAQA